MSVHILLRTHWRRQRGCAYFKNNPDILNIPKRDAIGRIHQRADRFGDGPRPEAAHKGTPLLSISIHIWASRSRSASRTSVRPTPRDSPNWRSEGRVSSGNNLPSWIMSAICSAACAESRFWRSCDLKVTCSSGIEPLCNSSSPHLMPLGNTGMVAAVRRLCRDLSQARGRLSWAFCSHVLTSSWIQTYCGNMTSHQYLRQVKVEDAYCFWVNGGRSEG